MSKAKTISKLNNKLPITPMPKTRPKNFPIPQQELNEMRQFENKKLNFSFRFLELEHEAFNLGGTCASWSNDVFNMMKELSKITRNDFVITHRDHYRSHPHEWDKLDYKYALDDEFLEQVECRQARISTSKGGIHGFLVGNMFYIIWLDPHHNLYPDERYGGIKKFTPPTTCCGYRDEQLNILGEKVKEYELLLEELTAPTSN